MPWGMARRIAELDQTKVNAAPGQAEDFGRMRWITARR